MRYKLQSKLKVPRPVSTEANPDVQATFKKNSLPGKDDDHLLRAGIAYPLFLRSRRRSASGEDESRLGLKTVCGRVITLIGVKPIVPVQWPRDNFWLYGAVEPTTGAHFFYEFSHLDTACFQRFIDLFAAAFPDSLNSSAFRPRQLPHRYRNCVARECYSHLPIGS